MGIQISADSNEYWLDKKKPVKAILTINNDGEKITITDTGTKEQIEVEGVISLYKTETTPI